MERRVVVRYLGVSNPPLGYGVCCRCPAADNSAGEIVEKLKKIQDV